MKIKRVKIVNYKNLKDIDVNLDGANVILRGDNEVGKSSFLDFVEIALGKKGKIPSEGSGKGAVWADKNGLEYKYEVKTDNGKSKIVMIAPDGHKEDNQSVIRSFTGVVEFDMAAFMAKTKTKAGRKEMVTDFKKLLGEEVNIALNKIDKEIDESYDERTEVGHKIKTLKGAISECPMFGDDLKVTQVDVTAINSELQKANEFNQLIQEKKARFAERAISIKKRESDIESLKNDIIFKKRGR